LRLEINERYFRRSQPLVCRNAVRGSSRRQMSIMAGSCIPADGGADRLIGFDGIGLVTPCPRPCEEALRRTSTRSGGMPGGPTSASRKLSTDITQRKAAGPVARRQHIANDREPRARGVDCRIGIDDLVVDQSWRRPKESSTV